MPASIPTPNGRRLTNGKIESTHVSCTPDTDHTHRKAVERVVGALRENTDVLLRLSDMAKIALVSRFHFDRLFRRFTGMPPRQFQSALRIADAKRLLLTSDMSALEVCLSVGYSSLGTFTRRFAEMVGLSPIGLRRLVSGAAASYDYQRTAREDTPTLDTEMRTGSIAGTLRLPEAFDGIGLVGLYRTPLPQGAPIACAAVTPGGRDFTLTRLRSGNYYALAAVIAKPSDPLALLLADVSAVGRETVRVEAGHAARITISIRPLEITDPPILTAIAPFVLRQFLARAQDCSPQEAGAPAEHNQTIY